MKHAKVNVLSVEKSKIKLNMDFNVNDVIDVLVSEQEENIEKKIKKLQLDSEKLEKEYKQSDDSVEAYMEQLVRDKYVNKIKLLESTFKEIGLNATVQFEIIDGSEMPKTNHRRQQMLTSEIKPKEEAKLVVALVICNKEFDKNTVDNTVSFFVNCEYDDKLKQLNKIKEEALEKVNAIQKDIREAKHQLEETSRLVRKAKATVTKKAIGKDVEELISDFRKQYPQIELKSE